ncbi:soluble quino protein glucose dehydrogenase [Thozetella sp. PMI_491]|nr:soluble quino protein glucose dehydrogenase [Thozetella sp. PMI_491]
MHRYLARTAVAACLYAASGAAQTTTEGSSACPTVLTPSYSAPVVGGGYTAQLIAGNLQRPRGILFDSNGALLVVQQGVGISHITFDDKGGTCLIAGQTTSLLDNKDLTHGIELSEDGKTLYASSSSQVFSWAYDASGPSVSNQRTLIQNMSNADHVTRTLLLSRKQPGLLLVSRGSGENIDELASQDNSGVSQIRVFNVTNMTDNTVYDYPSQGMMLGWGLRNSVGVAEEPTTGNIYSVENSADQIKRDGTDIHQDNPGEEMNFHGTLASDDTKGNHGGNFGYPECLALWSTDGVPNLGSMTTGSQFSLEQTDDVNDDLCSKRVAPRLTFQAHTAPLDIKFTSNGTLAYVTFHGSWNRDVPVGYKLSVLSFANGEPTEAADSKTAAKDVLSNPDASQCPDKCFRPAGLALDSQGRIFMTSDSTGEIYVLRQADMSATGTGTSSSTGTLVTSTSGTSPNAAPGASVPHGQEWLLLGLTLALSFVGSAFFFVA